MKITKVIYLQFAGTSTATAYINVPFNVKKMHIKSAAYNAGTNGTTNYIVLNGNIGEGVNPLAVLNQDTTYSSGTISDVEIEFMNAKPVNGNYTFQILKCDGTPATTSNNGAATDNVALVIEFNSPDELF